MKMLSKMSMLAAVILLAGFSGTVEARCRAGACCACDGCACCKAPNSAAPQ